MRTLYLTDLDGTFLNSKGEISEHSAALIDEITSKGALFSIATARTYATVMEMFEGVFLPCPLVLMNGVTVYDPIDKKILKSNPIPEDVATQVLEAFRKHNIEPMLYFQNGEILDIYYSEPINEYQKEYVSQRMNCKTKRFIKSESPVSVGGRDLVYIVSLDSYEQLNRIYNECVDIPEVRSMFYRDTYTDCYFLEIITSHISKGKAAQQIKEMLCVDKIIAFGDNLNDIPLFEVADECYAVSNAHKDLKALATGIIASNDEDAVSEFIYKRFNNEL